MSDVTRSSALGLLSATAIAKAGALPRVAGKGVLLKDVVALTKPRITAMAVIVAAGALLLAPGSSSLWASGLSLLAIAMAVAGAGALNMYIERDVDLLMERTHARPLPSGRLEPWWALGVGFGLSLLALPLLWVAGSPLASALTAFSLFVYVLVYTPMKRTSPWALVVGAVPGAMPALMGSTAVTGRFDVVGVSLFFLVFLWQLPHFIAIAIYRQSEYVAAGHKVTPAVWGLGASKVLLAVTTVLTAVCGVLLWPLGVGSAGFGAVALLLGLWFVVPALRGAGPRVHRTRPEVDAWARRVFHASLLYQTILFAALAVDAIILRGQA